MDVSQWISFWGRYTPGTPAIIDRDRTVTYAELEDRVARIAGGLLEEGLGPGASVGMLAKNAAEFFDVVMACARIGAKFVPLNDRLTVSELRFMVEDAGIDLVVTDDEFVDQVHRVSDLLHDRRVFTLSGTQARPFGHLLQGAPVTALHVASSGTPLFVCYTSGTTGRPKGAVLTHDNVIATANSVATCDGLTARDRALMPVPLAFTGSCVSVGMPFLHVGGSIVLDQSVEADQVLQQIGARSVTFMSVVPVVYQRIVDSPLFGRTDLSSLRIAKSGGAPVPESLIREIQARGVGLIQAFGITEGGGYNLALPSRLALDKLGSAGMSVMYQDAKVVDEEDETSPLGKAGELVLRGPMVMQGYLNDEAATRQTLVDGWLHTGDLAVMDEDGCFRIVDRKKDMLISGGINVYPAEIERVLAAHPHVREIAVIGVADEKWGEVPWACVVSSDPTLAVDDLNEFSADQLAKFKRLGGLTLLDELPRGMSGKVIKRDLRAKVQSPVPG